MTVSVTVSVTVSTLPVSVHDTDSDRANAKPDVVPIPLGAPGPRSVMCLGNIFTGLISTDQ